MPFSSRTRTRRIFVYAAPTVCAPATTGVPVDDRKNGIFRDLPESHAGIAVAFSGGHEQCTFTKSRHPVNGITAENVRLLLRLRVGKPAGQVFSSLCVEADAFRNAVADRYICRAKRLLDVVDNLLESFIE